MNDRDAVIQLGLDHLRAGRLDAAETVYRDLVSKNSADADALHFLGVVLAQKGDLAKSADMIRRAISFRPAAPAFHYNLGKVLARLGALDDAMSEYRHAISLAPAYKEAHVGLAAVLARTHDYVGSEKAYRRAVELAPTDDRAIVGLALSLFEMRRPGEAIAELRRAYGLRPDPMTARFIQQLVLYDPNGTTNRILGEDEYGHSDKRTHPAVEHTNVKVAGRRLRVGWLSSDFREHPVARNIEPIFAHRDASRFEYVCYAEVEAPDQVTESFRARADLWRSTLGLDDAAVAAQIRADQIDVMIYLAGRFDRNRPQVAAWRPAPVQVSFYDAATSGLAGMDYLVADPVLVPRRTSERFTERVIRLPHAYMYSRPPSSRIAPEPPSGHNGYVTFGSMNHPGKTNDAVIELWGRLLGRMPGSRLLLGYRGRFAPLRDSIERQLSAHDVSGDRLIVADRIRSHDEHLALYNEVDIALDPFPFTGSTTTFEALWMGVPVVTLLGERMVSRLSASILRALKLDELIARTPQDYVEIAQRLGDNRDRLKDLRRELREKIDASPLLNGDRNARHFERLLRAIWRRWCRQA